MILAAGLGTRMRPLSPRWAKPSLPVLDEPLLLRMVRGLAEQGVETVVVNTHAQRAQIRDALKEAPVRVVISSEPELRGSGGGILHARELLEGEDPFFVLNGDMCLDLDLRSLREAHLASGAVATLALRRDSRGAEFGTIGYSADRFVRRVTEVLDLGAEDGCGLFTGLHAMGAGAFDQMPDRACFDIVRHVYVPLLQAGQKLGAWIQPTAASWWPVGCPRELLNANLEALRLRAAAAGDARLIVHPDARVEGELTAPVFIGAGAQVSSGARVGPHAVVGAGAQLPDGSRARESLLLPGARLSASDDLVRAIAFDGEVWRDA